jgi:hypothetical protein
MADGSLLIKHRKTSSNFGLMGPSRCLGIEEDEEFCSIAKSHGLLERDHSWDGLVLLATIGLVLAPIVAECLASTLCTAIAGGVADAISAEGAAFTGAMGAGKLVDEALDVGNAARAASKSPVASALSCALLRT